MKACNSNTNVVLNIFKAHNTYLKRIFIHFEDTVSQFLNDNRQGNEFYNLIQRFYYSVK